MFKDLKKQLRIRVPRTNIFNFDLNEYESKTLNFYLCNMLSCF